MVVAAFREDLPVELQLVARRRPGRRPVRWTGWPRLDRWTGPPPAGVADDARPRATAGCAQDRLGDTLVFLTGPGGRDDLGAVGALRGAYPSVMVGVFGGRPTPAPPARPAWCVIDAAQDGDGVRRRPGTGCADGDGARAGAAAAVPVPLALVGG